MYTSELDIKRDLIRSITATVFFALFGAVYELFSHEVYSYYMIYAFALPLLLGVLPYALLLNAKKYPCRTAAALWNSGAAVLSVGCAFRGALDIYGTTNSLIIVYPVAGAVLLTAGLIAGTIGMQKKKRSPERTGCAHNPPRQY